MIAPTLHSVVTRTEARDCRWEAVWADRYAEVVESAPATESDRPYACLKGTAAMSTESAATPAMTYRLVSMPILVCAQLDAHQMNSMTDVHLAAQATQASCARRHRAARGGCSVQALAIFRDGAVTDCASFGRFMSGS